MFASFASGSESPAHFEKPNTLDPYETEVSPDFVSLLHPRNTELKSMCDSADKPISMALCCYERTIDPSEGDDHTFSFNVGGPNEEGAVWGCTNIRLEMRAYFDKGRMNSGLLEAQWPDCLRYSGLGNVSVKLGNCELFSCPGGAFFGFLDQFEGKDSETYVKRYVSPKPMGPDNPIGVILSSVWTLPWSFSKETPLLLKRDQQITVEFGLNVLQLKSAGFEVEEVKAHLGFCEPVGAKLELVRYTDYEQILFAEHNASNGRCQLPLPSGRVRKLWFALLNCNREHTAQAFSRVALFKENKLLFSMSDRALYDAMREHGCASSTKGYGELDLGMELDLEDNCQLSVDFGKMQAGAPVEPQRNFMLEANAGMVSRDLANMLSSMSNQRYGVMTSPQAPLAKRLQLCCFRPKKFEVNLESGAVTSGSVSAEGETKGWWSLW